MTGPSVRLDPAIHAVRRDLADVELADRVFAPHYAAAVSHRGTIDVDILSDPVGGECRGRLAPGERFAVFDLSGGWAWGQSAADVVGYVPQSALTSA